LLGWRLDADYSDGDFRVVQLAPPGSSASIIFGTGVSSAEPGSAEGLHLDDDVAPLDGLRIVQFTPPGSACSITFGIGITTAAPGSAEGALIVSDIEAAHKELVGRGIEVSDVWHGPPFPVQARQPGHDPERTSYGSFFGQCGIRPDRGVEPSANVVEHMAGETTSGHPAVEAESEVHTAAMIQDVQSIAPDVRVRLDLGDFGDAEVLYRTDPTNGRTAYQVTAPHLTGTFTVGPASPSDDNDDDVVEIIPRGIDVEYGDEVDAARDSGGIPHCRPHRSSTGSTYGMPPRLVKATPGALQSRAT
jgi:hypothetical protein